MNQELIESYAYWRSGNPKAGTSKARNAIECARRDIAAGKRRYGKRRSAIIYNRASDKGARWIENASDGLRLVGFADELISLRHTGWHCDPDGDGAIARGIVYRLPSRNGAPRFAYGVADPHINDSAVLEFDATTESDAAHWADSAAQKYGEDESEYQAAWQAGNEWRELGESVAQWRSEIIEFCQGHRNANGAPLRALCEAVRRRLASIKTARNERASLASRYYQREPFNEGAGEDIL